MLSVERPALPFMGSAQPCTAGHVGTACTALVALCAEAAGGRQACRQAGRQQAGSSRQQHRQQQAGSSSSGSSTSITLPVAIM